MSGIGDNSNPDFVVTPEKKQQILNACREIDRSMTLIRAEQENITEVVKKVNEETQLDKRMIRKIARTYHLRDFPIVEQENDLFEDTYREVTR